MESDFAFRPEEPRDYAASEALIREAFWNIYKPGCDEHYIVHKLRGSSDVIETLNYVCEDAAGDLCGHIFYTRSNVVAEGGAVWPVITFGPISVRPDCQRHGIGSKLIRMTLTKAADMGFSGVLITGNPRYYHRFGFRDAADYGIVAEDGSSFPELMALELGPRRLNPVRGRLYFSPAFSNVNPEELQAFDAQFPCREKLKLPGQLT